MKGRSDVSRHGLAAGVPGRYVAGPVSEPSAAEAHLATLRQLFPGFVAEFARGGRGTQQEYVLFPSASRPKLMVPAAPRRAGAQAMLRFSTSTRFKEMLVRRAAGVFLRTAPDRLLADRIVVSGTGDSIVDHLSRVFGRRVEIAIGIGTVRANRKPVLEVFDDRGTALGFAKVGVDEISLADVQGEARNLALLRPLVSDHLEMPELIDASWWADSFVLVMSSLSPSWGRSRRQPYFPAAEMMAFARATSADGPAVVDLTDSKFWVGLRERAGADLPDGRSSERLLDAIRIISERWGQVPLELGGWHGDWTPWNMAWGRERLKLWDFERFDGQGLVGLDALHFGVNEAVHRGGPTPGTVLSGVAHARSVAGLPAATFDPVAAAYLASLSVRYRAAAAGLRGDSIASRADLMIDSLHDLLELRKGP